MIKVIVVLGVISEWELPIWPPSIQIGRNGWNILGFNFTNRDALSSVYI